MIDLCEKHKLRKDPATVRAVRTLLALNLATFPGDSEATVRRFLDGAGVYAQSSALLVCLGAPDPPVAALRPLLGCTGVIPGEIYLVKGAGGPKWPKDDDYLDCRICDRAYEVISRILGDANTNAIGTRAEMDSKIELLAARLRGDSASWPFTEKELQTREFARRGAHKTARTNRN